MVTIASIRQVRISAIIGLCLLLAAQADATSTSYGTISARFWRVEPGSSTQILGGAFPGWVNAGIYRYRLDRSNPATTWTEIDTFYYYSTEWFPGFCMELAQYVNGPTTYNVQDLPGTPVPGAKIDQAKADLLEEYWGRYGPEFGQWPSWTGWTNASYAEAFQVGIWNIIYDSDLDVLNGEFRVNGSTVEYGAGKINTWLASLDGKGPVAPLMALTHPNYQDILVVDPPPLAVIPEPLTLAGVFWGISLLAGYIRKRGWPGRKVLS